MKKKGVEEVALETPTSNTGALHLYTSLGFAKTKFLHRYYLDGQDAVRLKLWLRSPFEAPEMSVERQAAYVDFQRAVSVLNASEVLEEQLLMAARGRQAAAAIPE